MAIARTKSRSQKGYILLSVMLLMTLMLIALSVELPRIGQQIKRDKEEELIHRAQEYTRAIKKFYRKFGRYPLSIDQLENTNNIRFLRKRFKDPMTGKDDWRIIHVGEALLKIPGSGGTANINGTQGGSGINTSPGGNNFGSGSTQSVGAGQNSQNPSGTSTGDSAGNSNSTSSSGSSGSAFANPQPGGGPMIGIASSKKAASIKIINEKDHYNEWEFVYDPRLEQQQLGGNMGVPNINGGTTGAGGGGGSLNTIPPGTQPPTSPPPGPTPVPPPVNQ